ncbi:hypothetical protein J2S74_002931 [Evansella vedderi]|uniref:Uncharacterized protein n=1 Tax=Evansella vedderi TaxID=38282 RepID=A0ABT9ZXH7_9BACI|nr:hypothetical protein [Evansella vedderi]MDQ0255549.1 hypothetical protein [Evansella vedderi]
MTIEIEVTAETPEQAKEYAYYDVVELRRDGSLESTATLLSEKE